MSSKTKDPQVTMPLTPPSPPSYAQQFEDYARLLPQQVALQEQYDPRLAELDYNLYQEYAPKYTQMAADIEKGLYPETYGLQENLAKQAREGMTNELPEWARDQYASDFNAGIGMNVNAPIGVDTRSRGMLDLGKQWGDYYRNLALSVAQRQPLQTTANPTFANRAMNDMQNQTAYNAQTYGSYSNAFVNQPVLAQPRPSQFDRALQVGSMISGGVGAYAGAKAGATPR